VGIVVTNRKEFPKFGTGCIKSLARGQHLEKKVINNSVHCFVWRDRKPVAFVDTICDPSETTVVFRKLPDGTSADFACPVAVKLYYRNMGAVDLADQLCRAYTCSRKSKAKWYMQLFFKKPPKVESHVHYPKKFEKVRECIYCSNRCEAGCVCTNCGCETCDLHMCIDYFKPYHIANKLT